MRSEATRFRAPIGSEHLQDGKVTQKSTPLPEVGPLKTGQTNMDVEKTVGFRSHQLGKNVLPNITTVLGPAPTEMRFVSTALEVIWAAPNVDHTLIGHPHQGQPQVPKASQLIRETALQDRPLLKFKWNYNSLLVAKNTWGKFNWALKKTTVYKWRVLDP